MTDIQSMMLAVCFGAVVGTFIGNLYAIIKFAIDDHKEKKRLRKENEDKQ
jgi:hypothetical protein